MNQQDAIVRIVDYDPGWPAEFERERRRLIQALGNRVAAVEHIGSTAVPGLTAKPIIDVAVAVDDLGRADECTPILEDLGYRRYPTGDFEGRVFFRYLAGGVPMYHLSITAASTEFWRDHLLFRDYLRRHPDTAHAYGELKKRLASEYGADRAGYTYAKTSFIEKIVGRGWIGQPPPRTDGRHSPAMTAAAQALLRLAQRLSRVYVARCAPRAVLLTGSAGEGLADAYSDLDVVMYYEGLIPDAARLDAVRTELVAERYREAFPRNEHACAEAYRLRGVEVEVAHFEIGEVERRLSDVLDGRDPGSTQHKAVLGILRGRPLHGADLIEQWQARCAKVPDALARAMVEHYLRQTSPLWYFADALDSRDATLWVHQALATNALNMLGVLAALNRRFYSTFQLKRMRHSVSSLPIAPPDLAERLEAVVRGDEHHGIQVLEALVRDSLELVRRHLPEADTSVLRYPPGARQQPWHVADLDE